MIDNIKKTLWATADKLRANMDAAEYKHIVLGLIFLKYISDTFQTRCNELSARFTDLSKKAEASCLACLRDTLLPHLISSQLRLPQAEALLEEAAA